VWDFHKTIKLFDLVEGIDTWRKSTVEAEDAILDNGCERQEVEEGCEVLPDIGVSILPQALIIKAVHLSDLLALMIASQNCDTVWESDLEADEKGDCLDRVVSAIDVVSHEQIVVVRELTSN